MIGEAIGAPTLVSKPRWAWGDVLRQPPCDAEFEKPPGGEVVCGTSTTFATGSIRSAGERPWPSLRLLLSWCVGRRSLRADKQRQRRPSSCERLRRDAEIRLRDLDFDRLRDTAELESNSQDAPPTDAQQPSVLDDCAHNCTSAEME